MRHSVIVAVIFLVIGDVWAQNRGSARYASPDEFEEDITRAPRPTRGGSFRRQRPTKTPEPSATEDELKAYQPPAGPPRTTARRVPQRGNRVPVTTLPPLPAEEPIPRFTVPVEERPSPPSSSPEEKAQGNRRRRPKKRRRPQNAVPKATDESEKPITSVHGEEKIPISELLNEDKKRTGIFQSNPTSRNAPTTFNADPAYPEKAQWENNPSSGQPNNLADSQYYSPQPAVNRLPVANPELVGNSRDYLETPPVVSEIDAPASYIPKGPLSSVSNDASYVPVLSPIRVPSDGASRLPPENNPVIRHQDSRFSSDSSVPPRGHNNISPINGPDDNIQNVGAKPAHNIIPQDDEPSIPRRSHSDTRLPESDSPHNTPRYIPPNLDSTRDLIAPNAKASEDVKIPSNPSHRLPNPSEIHYESIYPEFSDDPTRGIQRIAGRRQGSEERLPQNPRASYSTPHRDTETKPRDYDNDAEVDRRQVSQYRPPLQRGSFRYKPEDSGRLSRVTSQEESPSTAAPRTRGSTRYQSRAPEYTAERTRGSSRTRSEPSSESPTRSRSSSSSRSVARNRGSQRYEPEVIAAPRSTTRGLPPKTEDLPRNSPSTGYVPVKELVKNDERTPLHSSKYENQPTTNNREGELEILPPIKNTLRSRPQYDIENDPETYEESVVEPGGYRSDYHLPPQINPRERPVERAFVPKAPHNRGNRGSQRYEPEITAAAPRSTTRGLPPKTEELPRNSPSTGYVPVEEVVKNERTPLHSSEYENQPTTNNREGELEILPPIKNTLRSRPQYDIENDPETYEESVVEPGGYRSDYHLPPQINPRERPVERTFVPRAPPLQPEYQLPPNRQHNRQETHNEAPQNPRSRQHPPQNPRVDSRQANNRQIPSSPRQQGRSRQQSEPATVPRNSAGRSNFKCPDAFGFFADPVQCDKYYECRNGTAEVHLCSDGLAFNEISAPKFLRCDSLRDVDCKSRPELQEPQPSKNCPRKFGLFPHESDCTKFWNCVDGTATEVQCPPGLTYSDDRATCDWADLVESSCKSEDLLGFTCPEPTAHDLVDGVYTRYPHPDNCQLHFTCIKGADGVRRPRMLSCTDGLVFDPEAATCKRPEEVPGCENFYGGRSQTPRKPARQPAYREPEPEPEELIEEPTPRPRRRGSNRRIRN